MQTDLTRRLRPPHAEGCVTDALGRHQKVLILGGGSEIAGATARRLLRRQGPTTIVLAARPESVLDIAELEVAEKR